VELLPQEGDEVGDLLPLRQELPGDPGRSGPGRLERVVHGLGVGQLAGQGRLHVLEVGQRRRLRRLERLQVGPTRRQGVGPVLDVVGQRGVVGRELALELELVGQVRQGRRAQQHVQPAGRTLLVRVPGPPVELRPKRIVPGLGPIDGGDGVPDPLPGLLVAALGVVHPLRGRVQLALERGQPVLLRGDLLPQRVEASSLRVDLVLQHVQPVLGVLELGLGVRSRTRGNGREQGNHQDRPSESQRTARAPPDYPHRRDLPTGR
jgi:hypothetical protein